MLFAIAHAVLSGVLTLHPLPNDQSFDGLSYAFATGGLFGPRGTLFVGADGKVSYSHATAPHTGSGGKITNKAWTVPKDEVAALFRELRAGGLLDLRDADAGAAHTFHLTAGKWHLALSAGAVPEKVASALRPLLAKAHPEVWDAKQAPPKSVPSRPVLTELRYEFAPKVTGEAVALDVSRTGLVTYRRHASPNAIGRVTVTSAEWRLPGAEAATLLDALGAAGALGLEDSGGGRFPNHAITARAGRWRTFYHPKELPEEVFKHLRPLLEKADPEFWRPVPPKIAPATVGAAVLAGALGIRPLPHARLPIDSLSYTFGSASGFGAGGSLCITKGGAVSYSHSTDPFTGSGGVRTHKNWSLTRDELAELFAKLVADGLLDGGPGPLRGEITVTSTRWRANLCADQVPEKAARHLRPLLERAHPALWGETRPAPAPQAEKPVPPPDVLWQFNYHSAPTAEGDHVLLYVGRGGEVSYQRYGHQKPGATRTHVQISWTIPAKDAEALLDALTVRGVCDLEIVERDRFPVHRVEVGCGPWWSTFHTKPLPDKFMELIHPLLQKADPEFWK